MAVGVQDTIYALSSGAGRVGVAVIRISGPDAFQSEEIVQGGLPRPRRAAVRTILDKTNNVRVDTALILAFSGPDSFTGENIVEIQCHGGRAVVEAIFGLLAKIPGFRPAEPGEFTRRAVENGRMDLVQAEALIDLINAETEAQRRQALLQQEGALSLLYEEWRSRLIKAAAWLEATIDFPDEEIPDGALDGAREELIVIRDAIGAHLKDGRRGEILREGLHVAVIGAPNAGKSSLVNALAQREIAIVTETPGTTRDVIDVRLDLRGFPVILSDTAGLREALDPIEEEGIRRAKAQAAKADVRLLVVDGSSPWGGIEPDADIVVYAKADLVGVRGEGLWISTKSGEGLDLLIERLANLASGGLYSEAPPLTRARYRHALEESNSALSNALRLDWNDPEIVAEEVRRALRSLGRITGRVDLDELLDVVFKDFCIGK